ncbi:MAG: hypothetical protein KBS81_00930, partial [Spirochaetales bacterium]|nr:hypothetical protein [Candidatus Physcosoma equi]
MIKDNSIVLDFEYSASAEDGTLVEILQFGAVRIINGDLCDFFNGIVLPAMDHIGSASRKRQMEQMLESNSVVRGSYEEVLVRYLKWLGYHVHETFIWGGTDYHALVRNTEKYCSQKVCSELAPHLTQFVDLVHSYHQSYRRNS